MNTFWKINELSLLFTHMYQKSKAMEFSEKMLRKYI